MARLVESRCAASATSWVATLVAAGLVAGCTSTQQKAAWLQLNNARLRAAQVPTRVRVAGSSVSVTGVTLLREGRRTAYVVVLRNGGGHPVSDLPISVGYRQADGRTVYVNALSGADYYASHLPLIARDGTFTWVVTAGRSVPAAARPFVRVGGTPTVPVTGLTHPPALSVGVRGTVADGVARVTVTNASGVTQYDLPLYAIARAAGRAVAAGTATVAQLNGGASETVQLRLLGTATRARLQVEAGRTIYN